MNYAQQLFSQEELQLLGNMFVDQAMLTDKIEIGLELDSRKQNVAKSQTLLEEEKQLTPVGGINLDPALLNMQIKRDGKGVPLPVNQQPMLKMEIEGFVPVIINVTPVNLPMLLGVAEQEQKPTDVSRQIKQGHFPT